MIFGIDSRVLIIVIAAIVLVAAIVIADPKIVGLGGGTITNISSGENNPPLFQPSSQPEIVFLRTEGKVVLTQLRGGQDILHSDLFAMKSYDIGSIILQVSDPNGYVFQEGDFNCFKYPPGHLSYDIWTAQYDYPNQQIRLLFDPNGYLSSTSGYYHFVCTASNGVSSDSYYGSMVVSRAVPCTRYFDQNGTENDPFLIQTPQDLADINCTAIMSGFGTQYFKLDNDLDLSTVPGGFVPINNFNYANLDGDNHQITNFSYNDFNKDNVGLFRGIYESSVKNLSIVNANVIGRDQVGILGGNSWTNVENLSTSGTVRGRNYVGGIIGKQVAGRLSLKNVSSDATVIVAGGSFGGGLVGNNDAHDYTMNISNSSFTGQILCEPGSHVGGLVGNNKAQTTIDSSYASLNIENCGGYVGGLIGYWIASYFPSHQDYIQNSHFTGNLKGTNVGGLIGYYEGDGNLSITDSFVQGNINGPVNNAGGLIGEIGYNGNSHIPRLEINRFNYSGNINVTMTSTNGNIGGIGGQLWLKSGSQIKDSFVQGDVNTVYASGLVCPSFQCGSGGLVGYSTGLSIRNSSYKMPVHGTGVSNDQKAGGIAGDFSYGSINNSFATGSVKASNGIAGGLTGRYDGGTGQKISQSYFNGAVQGNTAGGLAGQMPARGEIVESFAKGTVSGRTAGGLVGEQGGYPNGGGSAIRNSYSQITIAKSPSSSNFIGGLVGHMYQQAPSTIENSYANNYFIIDNCNNVGGVVGRKDAGTVSQTVYNQDRLSCNNAIGIPKTEAEMKNQQTYTALGWNFTNVWRMPSGDYPRLQWEPTPKKISQSTAQ